MSQENMETVETAAQVLDALSRRDLARVLTFADPEIEWRSFFAKLGEEGVYKVIHFRAFREPERALEAVGLER